MRVGAVVPGAALLAAGLALACAGCAPPRPAADTCWQLGVRAIERHVTVRSVPPACAGLTRVQLNEIVSGAVRQVAGPQPKAIERRIAAADARYLASLVRQVPPPSAAVASPVTGPDRPGSNPGLIAAGCWAATVAAGLCLSAAHRGRGRIPAVVIGHGAVAVTGLAAWAAFAVAHGLALAWTGAALIITAAGLGMAVLLRSVPEPSAQAVAGWTRGVGWTPVRVLAVAGHAAMAVVTIMLVLLAAIGT